VAYFNVQTSESQKADFVRSYALKLGGEPWNLAGAEIVFRAKSGMNEILATTGNGQITIDNAAAGTFSIFVPKATLAARAAGNYALELLITQDGVTTEVFTGSLQLRPGVV